MRTTDFIYQPKSGDRVFAHYPTPETGACIEWSNGCRHVLMDGLCRLRFDVAQQGAWWRDDARRLATAVVGGIGGLAVDDRGTIDMYVPMARALAVHYLMTAGGGLCRGALLEGTHHQNRAELVLSGAAQIRPTSERGLAVVESNALISDHVYGVYLGSVMRPASGGFERCLELDQPYIRYVTADGHLTSVCVRGGRGWTMRRIWIGAVDCTLDWLRAHPEGLTLPDMVPEQHRSLLTARGY